MPWAGVCSNTHTSNTHTSFVVALPLVFAPISCCNPWGAWDHCANRWICFATQTKGRDYVINPHINWYIINLLQNHLYTNHIYLLLFAC
jgi:hypothetical protein